MLFLEVAATGDELEDQVLASYLTERVAGLESSESVGLVCAGSREGAQAIAGYLGASGLKPLVRAYLGAGPISEDLRELSYPILALGQPEASCEWDSLRASGSFSGRASGGRSWGTLVAVLQELDQLGGRFDLPGMKGAIRQCRAMVASFSPNLVQATLAETLRAVHVFLEVEEEFYLYQDEVSRHQALRRTYWEDLGGCPLLRLSPRLRELTDRWPGLFSLKERLEFLAVGQHAASSVRRDVQQHRMPRFFVWLTLYLLRIAEHYLRNRDTAAALVATVRAFEIYLQGLLVESGAADFEEAGTFLLQGRPVEGVGAVWRTALDTLRLDSDDEKARALWEVIRLRNRSALGHGVQRPSVAIAEECLGAVKTLVRRQESRDLSRAEFLQGAWGASHPGTVSDLSQRLASQVRALVALP